MRAEIFVRFRLFFWRGLQGVERDSERLHRVCVGLYRVSQAGLMICHTAYIVLHGSFLKLGVPCTIFGVLIIRILLFRVLY